MALNMVPRYIIPVLLGAAVLCAGCSSATTGAPAAPAGSPSAAAPSPASGVPEGAPQGTAKLVGGVQRISIDLSKGSYDPGVVIAKADVPLEITFGQGQGCLASVLVPDFGVNQDLTAGPAVVKLPAMKAGEYGFSCGMRMVFGKIVVR